MASKCIFMMLLTMHLAVGDISIADVTNKQCEGVDVVFLMDTSRRIGIQDFKYQLNFASDLIDQFNIGRAESQTRVGVVTMGYKPFMQFYLRSYGSKGKLKFAIQNIRHRYSPSVNAAAAIDFTSKYMFKPFFGGRNDGTHVMIVITDGLSQIQKETKLAIQRARKRGIYVFAIGIGPAKIQSEFENVTSEPTDGFSFIVPSYKAIETIKSQMPNTSCDVPTMAPTTVTTMETYETNENKDATWFRNVNETNTSGDIESGNTTKFNMKTADITAQAVSGVTDKSEGSYSTNWNEINTLSKTSGLTVDVPNENSISNYISNENVTSSTITSNENVTSSTTTSNENVTSSTTTSNENVTSSTTTSNENVTSSTTTSNEYITGSTTTSNENITSSAATSNENVTSSTTISNENITSSTTVSIENVNSSATISYEDVNDSTTMSARPLTDIADSLPYTSWVSSMADPTKTKTSKEIGTSEEPFYPSITSSSESNSFNKIWKKPPVWIDTKAPIVLDPTELPTSKPIIEESSHYDWPDEISNIFKKQFKLKIAEKERKHHKTFNKNPREDMLEKPFRNHLTTESPDNNVEYLHNDVVDNVLPQVLQVLNKLKGNESLDSSVQKLLSNLDDEEDLPVTNEISNDVPLDLAIKDDPRQYCGEKDVDIFFALDSSSSIWPEDFKKQINFVIDLVKTMDFRRTRIGILVYSDDIHMKVALDSGWSKQQIIRQIKSVEYVSGLTNTSDAIMYLRKYGFTKENARDHAMKLGIIMTDGISRDPLATKEESRKCREDGIVLFAIGIGKDIDKTELKRIANDPDDKYVFHVNGFGALASIRSEVAISACGAVPDQPSPLMSCGNGAIADVLFVYDAPALGARKSGLITSFVHDVSRSLQLSPNHLRIGRRTDNCPFISDIGFRSSSDKSVFSTLQFPGIETLISKLWTAFPGRIDSKNLAVVFVDESTQNIEEATKILKNDKNFKVLVVAIGDPSFSRQARDLASQPINEYFVNIPSYMSLGSSQYELLQKLCYLITNKSMYQQDMRYRVRDDTWLIP